MSSDSNTGALRPVQAGASVSDRVTHLNLDYLELLTAGGDVAELAQGAGLSVECLAELACAPHERLQELAGSAVSLFTASLHNVQLWKRLVSQAGQGERYSGAQMAAAGPAPARANAFLQCVLFYAWHLAHVDRGSIRRCLGANDEVSDLLLGLELWQLQQFALRYPQLLVPRWIANACFWPDLVQYARSGERCRLDYARLLGTQLLAQDLEPSAIEHLTALRRHVRQRPDGRG